MMGKLDRGEANIGVANLYVSNSRVDVLDFGAPYDLEVSLTEVNSEFVRLSHLLRLFSEWQPP